MTEDYHGSAATLTNEIKQRKAERGFDTSAEVAEERSFFTSESKRYDDSGYNSETGLQELPSPIMEETL